MAKKNVIAWMPGDTIKIDRAISKAIDAVLLNFDDFMVVDLAEVKCRDFAIHYINNVHHLNIIKKGNSLVVVDIDNDIKKAQAILKCLFQEAFAKIDVAMSEGKKEISIKFANNDYLYRLCAILVKNGFRVSLCAENTINISWA